MKKLFFFLALLLPIGAWADETVIAEIDWTQQSEYLDLWYSEDCTVTVGTEGLIIESTPSANAEYWQPQIPMIGHVPVLKEGRNYQVMFTLDAPAAGKIRLDFCSWDESSATSACIFNVEAGKKEYIIDFPDYPTTCSDAMIFYQCGKIPGKHVISDVKVIDKGTLVSEIDWTQQTEYLDLWYSEGTTVSVDGDGLVIDSNPSVYADYWQPQIPMISHIPEVTEGGQYQVKFTLNSPAAGEIRLDFCSWDGTGATLAYNIYVEAGEKEYIVDFPDYPTACTDAFIFYQCGKIPGTHIIKNVQLIDQEDGVVSEIDWTHQSAYFDDMWYSDGATVSVNEKGLVIESNPSVEVDYWQPQIPMIGHIPEVTEGGLYQVKFTLNSPASGEIRLDFCSWDGTGATLAYNIYVEAGEKEYMVEFPNYPITCTDAMIFYQCGKIPGKHTIKKVEIVDMTPPEIPVYLAYETNETNKTATVIESPKGKYNGNIVIPSTVRIEEEVYTVTAISDNAFADCATLTSISIPKTVTFLTGSSFWNCASLKQITVDPKNPVYDSRNNCNAIIETGTNHIVVGCLNTAIPDDVTEIGNDAFMGRSKLKGIVIPESVTSIGSFAFYQTALHNITLPKGLTAIREHAFDGCDNLTEVEVLNPEPIALSEDVFSNRANATLNVPNASIDAYKSAEYWKDFGMIVNVLAEENWNGPYWFGVDDGVGATYNMTAEGLAITNPTVQEERWKLQTIVIQNVRLQKNHSYKVIVSAKIPAAGKLQVNLCNWENVWDNDISVNASNDFQDFEFLYENCPYYAESGFLFFQNGCIVGTSVVRNVQILDITDGEEVIAEKNWAAPYWFAEDGVGATYEMTADGLAISNPKVQENAWTPQSRILQNARLQKNHTYKVIVNAMIPSDGNLRVELGSWGQGECVAYEIPVTASSDFQDVEFLYQDYSADAEDGHVLFQNGHISGTCIVRNVRILDLGDNHAELAYNYNAETKTAEVIKNGDRKYTGDIVIPATVTYQGEVYTVTTIKEGAFESSNITSITIPATMTTIEPHSFAGTNDLMQITVDPANTVFDSRNNCNGIIEKAANKLVVGCQTTVIPDGITVIGEGAFHGRHKMTNMTIPESVKTIDAGAFAYCYSLAEVKLPANIEILGWWAFLETPIKSITLPATLTTIGNAAFDGCSQLTEVTALNPAPIEIDGSAFSNRANATLYLPAGAKKAYKAAPIWKEFKETVEAEHNTVYSYDLTAYLGVSTGMDINLQNWDTFTAYQFDIVLPEGITLEKKADGKSIKFTKGKRCAGSRSISVTARDNNTYRVICISTKNEVITGNDGALLTVYLIANENMGKKTTQAKIENVIMTTPEEKQVNFDPTTVTITTKTLLLGDSNDDTFVNVTDLVATVNYILGRPSDKFNKTAADITKDHVIDIFDVNSGLGLIKNGTRAARMMTRAGEASNDKMFINDFSISAGMTKQMQIKLSNKAAYTGFQFDLVLPEGIKITSYSTTARIPEDMNVDYNETEGVYRFLGGMGETAITGTSGAIINITVKAEENLKGRNLTGYLRDVKLGLATGDGPTIEETPFKITDETSGDLNKNGKLDPADVKAIAELIMKGEYKAKADVNGDNKVNAADIVDVTNEIK